MVQSIINQIEYLTALETGRNMDRSRLGDIVIGIQSAREVEPLDLGVAELLDEVDSEAQRMWWEGWKRSSEGCQKTKIGS